MNPSFLPDALGISFDVHRKIWQLTPQRGGLFDWRRLYERSTSEHMSTSGHVVPVPAVNFRFVNREYEKSIHTRSPVSVAPTRIEFLTLDDAVEWAFSAPPCLAPACAIAAADLSGSISSVLDPNGAENTQIFIGDLSGNVSEQDLVECFSNYGAVRSAYIKRDSISGKCIGFGFVEFQSGHDAERARICAHRLRICSRRIRIGPAYHRRNGYEVVAYKPPVGMTTETLHRTLTENFGQYAFDPHGTFVLEPRRLGPLWQLADRVVRIRFRQSWIADLIVQAGWIEWWPGTRSPVEAADPYAICRNGIEVQFSADTFPDEHVIRQSFEGFGAPVQDVLPVPRKHVAYVIYEASWRGMYAALTAMRRVHMISATQVWCHHCKVSAEFLLAYGMSVADWELRQTGVIPSDSHVVYVGCPAKLPDLLVDQPY
ncbi:hypothetical protein CCYA_CCYA07G2198 [Cyanidiococcus yangmingshanensis]|nr:hypothetical protein CCYA_CCYA07G2198 [Cyanidiococcus yangmingshanensis]